MRSSFSSEARAPKIAREFCSRNQLRLRYKRISLFRELAHKTDTIGLFSLMEFSEGFLVGTIYKCEICGQESSAPVRWFVIHCSDAKLGVYKWDAAQADKPKALHFCGEGHAQVYISRWFESFCGSSVMTGGK